MAAKRMFNCRLLRSDHYTSLSFAAQSLYIQINLSSDDDGFCNDVKSIMKGLQIKEMYLNELINAGLIIKFNNGLIVVCHWNIHNTLKNDRYNGTLFAKNKELLELNENKVYQLKSDRINLSENKEILNLEPQYSLEQYSKSLDNSNKEKENIVDSELHVLGKYHNVFLTQNQALEFIGRKGEIDYLSEYIYKKRVHIDNHYEALNSWVKIEYSQQANLNNKAN